MFKRKLEMRLVKDTKEGLSARIFSDEDAAAFTGMVKQVVTYVCVGAVLATLGGVLANVAGEITVNKFTQ